MPFKAASDALSHIKVIDLTRVRAGPTCARQFADWGADVIMVELPLDNGQVDGQAADFGGRHKGDFQNLHRNKRSLTLNLKDPSGVEVLHRLVKDADKPINIAPMPQHFAKFCDVLGRPELATNDAFATPALRLQNRPMLNEAIAHTLRQQDSDHWITAFNEAGIPCGPVNNMAQVFEDPQVQHLGLATQVTSQALGTLSLLGQPMTMSRSKSSLVRATPERGENSHEILAELGYSGVEIEKLRHNKIL